MKIQEIIQELQENIPNLEIKQNENMAQFGGFVNHQFYFLIFYQKSV